MSLVKRWAAKARSRVRRTSWRGQLAGAALVATVGIGLVWLLLAGMAGRGDWLPACARRLDGQELAAATALAERHGIACRAEDGRVLVPADRADLLRGLLAAEGLLTAHEPVAFDELAADGDIWRTESQNARRWQAWKMEALSRMVGQFPAVRRAVVLFEPGVPRGLGRPAVAPTAAVKVSLAAGRRMDAACVAAVADLVAGSIAGLAPADVRIVDDTGRSYRAGASATLAEDPAARADRIEARWTRRLRAALEYVPDAAVSVTADPDPAAETPARVCVSVPRSYLVAAWRAAEPGTPEPNDARLDAFAPSALAKVRRTVANALGAGAAGAILVDWHHDAVAAGGGAQDPSPPEAPATVLARTDAEGAAFVLPARAGVSLAFAAGGLLAGLAAARHRVVRRRARGRAVEARRTRRAGPDRSDRRVEAEAPEQGDAPSPLAELRRCSADELREMLTGEHAQTAALVLAEMTPSLAADVLAGMSAERQIEVSRRIAEMCPVAGEVLEEVARGLLARRGGRGGAGQVARILHHAGYATEKAVLDALRGDEPALADCIRQRMFVFEDVALLPREVLAAAVGSLGSDELAVALRTAGREVTEKLLAALPPAAAERTREQMESIGPVRLSDVEAAQERVVAAVRRQEAGRYVPARAPEESEVVV